MNNDTETAIANATSAASRYLVEQPGPNKLQQALDDYDHLTTELAHTKAELNQYIDLANKMQAENEALKDHLRTQEIFFTRQIDSLTDHRDRLLSYANRVRTRFKVIREIFQKAEEEALTEGFTDGPQKGLGGGRPPSTPLEPNRL